MSRIATARVSPVRERRISSLRISASNSSLPGSSVRVSIPPVIGRRRLGLDPRLIETRRARYLLRHIGFQMAPPALGCLRRGGRRALAAEVALVRAQLAALEPAAH